MHSIRTRITSYTIAAIVICSLLIGTISILTVKSKEDQNSGELMQAICDSKSDKINYYLNSLEDSVNMISRFIYDSMDPVVLTRCNVCGANGSGISLDKRNRSQAQLKELDDYLAGHLADVDQVFSTIASNNTNVISYYYYLNPEFDVDTKGFWYSRVDSTKFMKMKLTDISEYPPDDFEHVGWYYLPLERGRPSWIEPYHNKNINETLVSYTIPVYKAGTFLGIIGMDIDEATLVDQIKELEVLDTGYAFLTDDKGKIFYHPSMETGTLLSSVDEQLDEAEKNEDDSSLIRYNLDGSDRRAAWRTLSNGMRLMVSAPESEINAGWRTLTQLILIITVLITMVVLFFSMVMRKPRIR